MGLDAGRRFVSLKDGFGGMVDCLSVDASGRPVVIDWKSQRTTPGKKAAFYDEWALQLAAYADGLHVPDARLLSVVISRTEPGRIEVKEWGDQHRRKACFFAVFALWQLMHDYYPGK